MDKRQRGLIKENATMLAKRKKELNPFDPLTQNSEFILWQQTYHKEIKYTSKQWERIARIANR